MKILNFFSSAITAKAFMAKHFEKLRHDGYSITVVAGRYNDDDAEWFASRGINFVSAPFSRDLNFFKLIESLFFIWRILWTYKNTCFISHTPIASFNVSVVAFLLRKKFIFYCHGLISSAAKKRGAYYWAERFTCAAAYKIFFVSPSLLNFAVEKKIVKQSKSYCFDGSVCGVDVSDVSVKPRYCLSSPVRIGFLGRIAKDKGVNDFLDVVGFFSPNQVVARIGGIFEDEDLKRRIDLNPQVSFVGYVDDKECFFNEIDILLFPSRREGFGMVAIEAAAYGVPVVAYNIVGVKDAVVNGVTGVLVNVGDIQAAVNAIQFYIDNDDLYFKHSMQAIDRAVSVFDSEVVVEKQVELIKKIIRDGNLIR
jgi:glycosyltransferase involved in cell wall biosynthesis